MININENRNIYGTINEKRVNEDGQEFDVAVVAINTSFNNTNGVTFSFNILDQDAVKNNREDIQTQLTQFIDEIRKKMKEMGYEITI